jgi:protoporphyrinogen oxidase
LTAANYLHQHRIPFRVFEAGKNIAGMACSHRDADGFTYDVGAHFLPNRLAAALGFSAHCRNVPRYGESVWLRGKVLSYPFGLMRNVRYLAGAVRSKLARKTQPQSAADWFCAEYGNELARDVAIPLVEAWSGAPAEELAAAVGEKMPGGILDTLLMKWSGAITKRAVAIGYGRTLRQSAHVWHVYPVGGIGAMCEHMAGPIKEGIQTESPVEAIRVDGNQVIGVRVKGKDIDTSAVVSTAPVHILAKLVHGTNKLEHLRNFRYRPMVFVNLRLQGRGFLPDVVVWTPEKRYPFFRLTETTQSMPWLAPDGWTMLTCDIGCMVGDKVWTMPDDEIARWCLDHLGEFIPDVEKRYNGCRVVRTPMAYPIFRREYEEQRQEFDRSTGIGGLYSVGRNGEFAHNLMEDVYWRTRRRMKLLRTELAVVS